MTATGFIDACGFIPTAGGTTDFVVSTAIPGYQTPASAGAVNATVFSYRGESADKSQWEEGFGAYTVSTTTLARTTVTASSTGAKVSFSSAPNVFITALSADLQNASLLTSGTLPNARLTAGQFPGTATNDNASAGNLGEYISSTVASASAVALSNNVAKDVTSIVLTAGDWDVWGNVISVNGGTITGFFAALSLTSNTLPTAPNNGGYTNIAGISTTSNIAAYAGQMRVSVAANTTVYLETLAGFSGSVSAYGTIAARRMR